ncbi:MAG TPA: inositol monophosphatase family protein [Intrasporangium sp.]|uniref:inositol monophosphatase family protein n=1 Tax=Intrasporangium sp. TaxID=1925024 RepID=UPI002D796B52|nr:inositol monophosphatase family protein [Intrasporangium sp.]HET7397369.1 inositol monophosphatase family protein [Intrasporangium sp.]
METQPNVTDDLLVELERLCVEFAVTAGALIRDERPGRVRVEATKSSDTDVVTVMDQRSEALLHRLVREHRPQDGILGEEGVDVAGTSGLTWVLDPIDGTVNYLYDIPAYAVSVAVVVGDARADGGWTPIAGAVCDPCRRLVHHARRGGGAWTRPERDAGTGHAESAALRVSTEDRLHRALLATGFGYDAEVRARQAEILRRVLPAVRDIRRIGSAALDLVRVADGSVDAYAESGINAWDLAAGWIIVEEAGGLVGGRVDRPGKALTVAAGPQLLERVRSLFLG